MVNQMILRSLPTPKFQGYESHSTQDNVTKGLDKYFFIWYT